MAQIILSLTSPTSFSAEASGRNGMREKLGEFALSDLPIALRTSLLAQYEHERAREREKTLELQKKNFSYVAATQGVGLAEKVWKRTLTLHKGNLVPVERTPRPERKPAPKVGDLSELEAL